MTSSFVCATLDLGSKKSTGTEPCGYYFLTFIYTHRQKLSNTTFFGDTVLEVGRTEYVGNGNQIFWILL